MSDNLIEITCSRCGHTWYEDLARLDEKNQVIYRDVVEQKHEGLVEQKTYRVRCSQCGTNNIVTVRFEETEDG